MRMHCLFSFSALLFLTAPLQAQPDSLWSRTFGGGFIDQCNSIVQTSDGGFALAGTTYSFGAGNGEFWLVRTDEDGDSLWSRTYGGELPDDCYSIIQTMDGGFALVGFTLSFGAGHGDFWLLRTDEQGDSLWSRTFGGEQTDVCYSIIQTMDGGFALAGYTGSFGTGQDDFWLVRTNSEGDSLWSRTFGGESRDVCHSIIQTADGGFAMAGWTVSFNVGGMDSWLVRADADGDSLWSKTFGGDGNEACYSIILTADDGFAMAGMTESIDAVDPRFWLVCTDENGESLWSKTYGSGRADICYSAVQTYDDGFALAGYTLQMDAGNGDYWLVRTDADGDSLWSRTFGGGNLAVCHSIIQTPDGGFALAGNAHPFEARFTDFWLVKTGPDPVSVPESDFILQPSAFILSPPYPNPFNGFAVTRYEVRGASRINLAVYNSDGRLVKTLANDWRSFGEYKVVWNAAGFPAGQYWVRLSGQWGGSAAQPVVLVK